MESRLPPALETAMPLRKWYLLGRTHSRSDPAQPRENLCGSVHIEHLRHSASRGDDPSQTVTLAFTDPLPLCFSVGRSQQTLHYVSVLRPSRNNKCFAELSLVLDAKAPVCVERAVMDVMELVATQ